MVANLVEILMKLIQMILLTSGLVHALAFFGTLLCIRQDSVMIMRVNRLNYPPDKLLAYRIFGSPMGSVQYGVISCYLVILMDHINQIG